MLLPGVDAWEFSSGGRYDNCSFKLPLTLDLLLQNVKQKDKKHYVNTPAYSETMYKVMYISVQYQKKQEISSWTLLRSDKCQQYMYM